MNQINNKLYSNRHIVVTVGVFNIYNNKTILGTYPIKTIQCKFNKLLNNKRTKVSYEYKSDFSTNNSIINSFQKINELYSNKFKTNKQQTTLRISTTPWMFNAHFDCGINYALCVLGQKRFILFNIDKNCYDITLHTR